MNLHKKLSIFMLLFAFIPIPIKATEENTKSDQSIIFQTGYRLSSCSSGYPVAQEMIVSSTDITCVQKHFNIKLRHAYVSNIQVHPIKSEQFKSLLDKKSMLGFFSSPQSVEVIEFTDQDVETIAGPPTAVDNWTEVTEGANNYVVGYTKKKGLKKTEPLLFDALQNKLNTLMKDVCQFEYVD